MEGEPLEDAEILLIITASERYSCYAQWFSAQQAGRLPKQKCWDHQILVPDPNAKIPRGAVCKTSWKEDAALQKYLEENIPRGKVLRSRCAAAAPFRCVHKKDGFL